MVSGCMFGIFGIGSSKHAVGFLLILACVLSLYVGLPVGVAVHIVPGPAISPNPVAAGQPVTFSGSAGGPAGTLIKLSVTTDPSSGHCAGTGTTAISDSTSLTAGLTYSFVETLSTPGYYCVQVIYGPRSDPGVSMMKSLSVASSGPLLQFPITKTQGINMVAAT